MARTLITKSGRKISAADVERLADAAERGFDLSTWSPRPGRPRLEPDATEHSPRIAVRIPASLHRRVRSRAAGEGSTVSRVVRRLLEEYANTD